MLEIRKAQRSKVFLKLGLAAPSGGGKTMGALMTGYGLMKEAHPSLSEEELWSKIIIIDSEHGSGELYSNADVKNTNFHIGEYDVISLKPRFTVEKYINAINLAQQEGYEVCIIDSSTQLWSGDGGLLDQHQDVAKRLGNSFTAWREITPLHNSFVELMLETPMHVIATMRSKQEYIIDREGGGSRVRKVGMEPQQRKGMEYEFTTFLEISNEHKAFCSKDRTGIFDGDTFVITPDFGKKMMRWLKGAKPQSTEIKATIREANPKKSMDQLKSEIISRIKELGGSKNEKLMALIKSYAPSGNTNSIKDRNELSKLFGELQDFQSITTKII